MAVLTRTVEATGETFSDFLMFAWCHHPMTVLSTQTHSYLLTLPRHPIFSWLNSSCESSIMPLLYLLLDHSHISDASHDGF